MKETLLLLLTFTLVLSCTRRPGIDEALKRFKAGNPKATILDISKHGSSTSCTAFIVQFETPEGEKDRKAIIYCADSKEGYWSEKDI